MEQQAHLLLCFFGFIIHRKSYYSERSSPRSTREDLATESNPTIMRFASSERKWNNPNKGEATRLCGVSAGVSVKCPWLRAATRTQPSRSGSHFNRRHLTCSFIDSIELGFEPSR